MKLYALTLFSFPMIAFAKGEINVRAHSLIRHGSPVVLGDICEMQGVEEKLKTQLLSVPLAAAPATGETLEFSLAAISGLLRNSLNFNDLPHVKIPRRVVIERASHKWEQANVEKELLQL